MRALCSAARIIIYYNRRHRLGSECRCARFPRPTVSRAANNIAYFRKRKRTVWKRFDNIILTARVLFTACTRKKNQTRKFDIFFFLKTFRAIRLQIMNAVNIVFHCYRFSNYTRVVGTCFKGMMLLRLVNMYYSH